MPFMHSEHLPDQLRCVELFRRSGNTENLKYAEDHADIVRRFGRFPHRNPMLGRETTPEQGGGDARALVGATMAIAPRPASTRTSRKPFRSFARFRLKSVRAAPMR